MVLNSVVLTHHNSSLTLPYLTVRLAVKLRRAVLFASLMFNNAGSAVSGNVVRLRFL